MSIDPIFLDTIKKGDVKKINRMLEGDPSLTKEPDGNGISPILIAAYHHKPEVAEAIASRVGILTIFEAAALGRTTQVIHILARNPQMVDACSVDGFQPLGLAAFFGHLETARYLVGAGAPVNSASNNPLKVTPLHSAAAGGHLNIAALLLEHGADPNLRQNGGFTPLHSAAQNGQVDMLKALLLNGADLTVTNDEGKSALDMAAEAGQTEAVEFLKQELTKRFRQR